jgi:hypothetical protein
MLPLAGAGSADRAQRIRKPHQMARGIEPEAFAWRLRAAG